MKIKRLILAIAILIMAPVAGARASTQGFYFKDFTADYYLSRLEDGTSKLHVKEILTAVFPETNQNHGITRIIPYTNQNGTNRTVENQAALNLTVLRNGAKENIAKIENENSAYVIYIGNASEYVHGEQVYTLEYDYTDVITEFDTNGNNVSGQAAAQKALQELYWDTNGNGWSQRFDQVTAILHLEGDIKQNYIATSTSCYVGRYGISGSERCTITPTDDGASFMASNLKSGENLTFAADFRPGTFEVKISESYVLVVMFIIVVAIALWVLIASYKKWQKYANPKRRLYNSLFTAPQYQPPEDRNVQVAEGALAYMHSVKSSYVATLLELAVAKQVTITKVSDKKHPDWSVHINVDPSTLSASQLDMLKILAGSSSVKMGDDIMIKKHTPMRTLANYAKDYTDDARKVLEKQGYFCDEKALKKARSNLPITVISIAFFVVIFAVVLFGDAVASIADTVVSQFYYSHVIGAEILPILMGVVIVGTIIASSILSYQVSKFAKYTDEGIKLVNYLDGLELYIKMAEKDRLEFLQSVKGADTSNAGIVKLYEKLLPWASLFGLEKSWAEELSKYYEIGDAPETISSDIVYGLAMSNIARSINNTVNSSTAYYNSSGGGGSSFSSGGGGGGFSGGGGGGGGGGGRLVKLSSRPLFR